MKRVHLALGDRSYDIHVGSGATAKLGSMLGARRVKRAFIISDRRLTRARAALKRSLIAAGWSTHELAVPAGEKLKEIDSVYPLFGKLLAAKASRDAVLFALGGGSVGDAAGFVASVYLRGIEWVGVPTTLLAQVDSAIGGKTAINHVAGKNLIGTFHQPSLVVCDTDFLKTLGPRELISGFGETVKYGLVFDPTFYAYLRANFAAFAARDARVLEQVIAVSAKWKTRAVAQDEHDLKGIRETLNFGHTFGHALEAHTAYRTFQHGEAVIWGMRFALALSTVRGWLAEFARAEIDSFLETLRVPPVPKTFGPKALFTRIQQDKKVRDGKVRFVLLSALGRPVSDSDVQPADLRAAFSLLGLARR